MYKIHLVTPWSDTKDLGSAYNEAMELAADNDWVCFTDMDAMHTTHFAPLYMRQVIEANKGYGLFTAVTNRVWNKEQIPYPEYWSYNDMDFHRALGLGLWDKHSTSVKDAKQHISGVVILTSKAAWKACGGFKSGLLGIDNEYDKAIRKAGLKVGIMQGVYVMHYYRNGDNQNKEHLK